MGARSALTPLQRRAVKMVAMGRPFRVIARELEIGETTIHRWKKEKPEFNFAVEQELRALEQLADDELRSAFPVAVTNARRLLSCQNESVELGASRLVIESVDKIIARRNLANEVDELREMVLQLKAEREGRATPV